MSKYDGVQCVDCGEEQAVCLDRCNACYKWYRGRIAGLAKNSEDAGRYLFRLRRSVVRVRKHFNIDVAAQTNVRRHTVAANGRRRHSHLGAAA